MKESNRKSAAGVAVLTILLSLAFLAGCSSLDVVANVSIKSFSALVESSQVAPDLSQKAWVLTAADGSSQFVLSQDFSGTSRDLAILVDAQPFLDAGLQPEKLWSGTVEDGQLIFSRDLSDQSSDESSQGSILKAYQLLLKNHRDSLGYHQALDHYGLDIGNGTKFEWAKDLSTNDKDLVFVLDPIGLKEAGTDVTKIEGWLLATVEVMDEKGNPIQVEKLLKPFSVK